MLIFALLACTTDGGDSAAAPIHAVATDTLPKVAPAFVLLAQLGADGSITVGGTVQSELWVDLDAPTDERDAFRYQVLGESGELLYERSTPGPVIVRDFLAYYGASSGFDLLEVYPPLGAFPVLVPMLDGAATVELQLRDDDGEYRTEGSYSLGLAVAEDQGVADFVSGEATLWEGGPPESAVDIVLLGDGYTADQQAEWQADADVLVESILGAAPFADFRDGINIHRLDAVSAESGASYDCIDECRTRDTAYQSVFPLEIVNALLGTGYRTTAVFQTDQWRVAQAASHVPWDFVLVLVNSEHSGGFAVHYASVAKGYGNWDEVAVHELAHVVGLLGDEYNVDDCIRSDALGLPVNITEDPESPHWQHWIDEDTPLPTPDESEYREVVGAFEGAYNCDDLYRPAMSCRMSGSSNDAFCPVCQEQLYRRFFRFLDPATGVTVSETDAGLEFAVAGLRPEASASLWVDGEKADGLSMASADHGGQSHEVELRVESTFDDVLDGGDDLVETWRFTVE